MAKDKTPAPQTVERAVRFRFTQHCFLGGCEGSMGQVSRLPVDVAQRLSDRQIGEIVAGEDSSDGKSADADSHNASE